MNTIEERQKQLEEFKKSLEGKSKIELEAIEQEIIKEAEAVDKELSEAVFDISGENYAVVCQNIQYFLNKQEIQWQFTVGMMSLYDAWNQPFNGKVTYPILHTTLQNLGQMTFKGYDEWKKVVEINTYFEPIREKYIELTEKPYTLASKHEAVMGALGLTTPMESN